MKRRPLWPFSPDTRICVSLAEPNTAALREQFDHLEGADLVEIRLDALDTLHDLTREILTDLVMSSPVPVGFTLRPVWQDGGFDGDESDRRRFLEEAAVSGAAFIDVELDAEWVADFLDDAQCPVVASHHWNLARPADLSQKVERIGRLAPSMAKLVATAEVPSDSLPLLSVGEQLIMSGQPATCFCMGEAGKASRLLAAGQGAALVYAAASVGNEVAAGQWSLRELVDEFQINRWQQGTKLCGLIGHPISHSLSPAIFNSVIQERGLDFAYIPIAGEDLDSALDLVSEMDFQGLSVTMPFKDEIALRSTRQDDLVTTVGAANTVVFEDSGFAAYNTDGGALVEALATVRPVETARIAVVGAGGAARAGASALVAAGAAVTILNRTEARAKEAAELSRCSGGGLEQLEAGDFDIIVNATPVGMQGTPMAESTPFPPEWLTGREVVLDMVYRPPTTPLLRHATERGCTTIEGLEMFIRQAAAQYRLLMDDPDAEPLDAMRNVAERLLMNELSSHDD
jgi:3-dehydroquinate dehydratase/shikimate dehydrogenase